MTTHFDIQGIITNELDHKHPSDTESLNIKILGKSADDDTEEIEKQYTVAVIGPMAMGIPYEMNKSDEIRARGQIVESQYIVEQIDVIQKAADKQTEPPEKQ